MTRRQLREIIFKLVFRLEFAPEEEFPEQLEDIASITEEMEGDDEDSAYIREKVNQIVAKKDEIDGKIMAHTGGWELGRIGKAELAILRVAVYELQYDSEVPEKVAINEAVELTKLYCDEDAKGFVNAVLGNIARGEAGQVKEKPEAKNQGTVTNNASYVEWKK